MDHMLRLLRSKCDYCGLLKLHRAEVNRFTCKLKLIQHGLLQESEDLENIHLRSKASDPVTVNGSATQQNEESDESEEEDDDEESLIERRIDFVRRKLQNVKDRNPKAWVRAQKIEVMAEQRRAVVTEFLGAASVTKVCGSCKG